MRRTVRYADALAILGGSSPAIAAIDRILGGAPGQAMPDAERDGTYRRVIQNLIGGWLPWQDDNLRRVAVLTATLLARDAAAITSNDLRIREDLIIEAVLNHLTVHNRRSAAATGLVRLAQTTADGGSPDNQLRWWTGQHELGIEESDYTMPQALTALRDIATTNPRLAARARWLAEARYPSVDLDW